jgi:cytochrome c oxidase subunit 2
MDAVPGMETHTWFFAHAVGRYDVLCAEYCGVEHSGMRAVLRVVPEPEYRAWLLEEE